MFQYNLFVKIRHLGLGLEFEFLYLLPVTKSRIPKVDFQVQEMRANEMIPNDKKFGFNHFSVSDLEERPYYREVKDF